MKEEKKEVAIESRKPVDIWMVTYQRKELTERAINYLLARTEYPYRLFVVDNHSTDGTAEMLDQFKKEGKVFLWLRLSQNVGIHMAHNIGLALVDSDYCISTDNDLYVPELKADGTKFEVDWLHHMVSLMDDPENKNYSAIGAQPHVFLGAKALDDAESGVFEAPMCGAVMRIMRTDVIKRVGGWDRRYDANRNHEEKTICSRIQSIKGKVGYASDVVCYHDFGEDNNWGYKDIHPHTHGHRIPGDEIWPMPEMLNNKELDTKTWRPKK